MLSSASQITYFVDRLDLNSYVILREFVNAHLQGTPVEIARAYAYYAFYMCQYRKVKRIRRLGRMGMTLSEVAGDWGVHAFCRHQYSISAAMGGDDVEAEKQMREAIPFLKRYLSYRDASVTVSNLCTNLFYRGHSKEVLELVQREQDVIYRSENPLQKSVALSLAYSQSVLLSRHAEAAEYLAQLQDIPETVRRLQTSECSILSNELMVLIDRRDFGVEADALIARLFSLNATGYWARSAHVLAGYVRMHQLFRTTGAQSVAAEAALRDALARMTPIAKTPAFLCHVYIQRAALRAFRGQASGALRHLQKAQKLAESVNSRWGLFEVAFQRARVFKASGDEIASRASAISALNLAREQGWRSRAYEIQLEFGLTKDSVDIDSSTVKRVASLRAETYVNSLLQVSLASASSLDPVAQSIAALDELNRVLNAERAYLFVEERDGLILQSARDSTGQTLGQLAGYSRTVVNRVREERKPVVVTGSDDGEIGPSESAIAQNLRSIIAAPLMLQGEFRGVIYLDSRMARGLFSVDDLEILTAIANHIAIALRASEIARVEIERRELQRDLELTAVVQSYFFPPQNHFENRSFSLCAYAKPASQASGDWWWFDASKDGSLTVIIGDVTGHGPAPAMMTVANASHLRMLQKFAAHLSIEDWLVELNRAFLDTARERVMMTLSIAKIMADENGAKLYFWNAAGAPLLLQRKNGDIDSIGAISSPLGTTDFVPGFQMVDLEPEDRIFLLTDGLTEMVLPNGAQLSERQFLKIVRESRSQPLQKAVALMADRLESIRQGTPLADDVTLVMVDISAEAASRKRMHAS
jgi:serine phosphatase RsbU (regulator of sigma subunit)